MQYPRVCLTDGYGGWPHRVAAHTANITNTLSLMGARERIRRRRQMVHKMAREMRGQRREEQSRTARGIGLHVWFNQGAS